MQIASVWVLCFVASAYAHLSPEFPAKVLLQAAAQSSEENVIVSPYSLIAPLGALSLASVYSTRRELLNVLGVDNKTEIFDAYDDYKEKLESLKNVTLLSANKLYISDSFKINHRFNTIIHEIFDVDVQGIDFTNAAATEKEVREWIAKKTQGRVPYWKLKPTYTYRAALVNAVLLNAPWTEDFHFKGTGDFHVNENKTVNAQYMNKQFGAYHAYTEDLHAEVFKIPYEGNKCSFVGVLPYVMNSIEGVLGKLAYDGNVINEVLKSQMTFKYLNLTMPLFNEKTTVDMKQLLQNLGVQKLFEDAKLYHLLQDMKLMYVNEAEQEISVSVNTAGTWAAAANSHDVKVSFFSAVPQDIDVLVDHPFYFEIRCFDITLINGVIRHPTQRFGLGQ